MSEIIKKDCITTVSDVVRNSNVNIRLEEWPCAVAILGVCATIAFVEWLKISHSEELADMMPMNVVKDAA